MFLTSDKWEIGKDQPGKNDNGEGTQLVNGLQMQLRNPMLIMTEEEVASATFCHDSSLPFTCAVSDSVQGVLEKLESMEDENRPVSMFLSPGRKSVL